MTKQKIQNVMKLMELPDSTKSYDYDKAIKLYKEHLEKSMGPQMKFKDVVRDDFTYFRKKGFDKSVMDKAIAELKLEMPKEYKD